MTEIIVNYNDDEIIIRTKEQEIVINKPSTMEQIKSLLEEIFNQIIDYNEKVNGLKLIERDEDSEVVVSEW